MIAAVGKLNELKLAVVRCFNEILLKMQNGYPFDHKDAKSLKIKEAIFAIDYIENGCTYDSVEAKKLIEFHILNLKG